jgi:hypothetical protein
MTYLATDASNDITWNPVDGTIDKSQIICWVTNWTDEQVLITAACHEKIEVLVVDFRPGNILDLNSEWRSDGLGDGARWDIALGSCQSRSGEEGRDSLALHLEI